VIPGALARATSRIWLPDRSGWWIILEAGDSVACPVCRRAMMFAVVRQVIDGATLGTVYSCIPCSPLAVWTPAKAAA